MNYLRIAAIWASGVIAAGLTGGMITEHFSVERGNAFLGFIAGACAFACLRLWLAGK